MERHDRSQARRCRALRRRKRRDGGGAPCRDNGLLVAVRGGGHNISGNAVCEGGLLIDLSRMRSVRVDPKKRTARVEPGVTLGEFDKEALAFGLATPLGINSTTGVAGLTLGAASDGSAANSGSRWTI